MKGTIGTVEKKYIDMMYSPIKMINCCNDNLDFDEIGFSGSVWNKYEVKQRYFMDENKYFLEKNDILLELYQNLKTIGSLSSECLENNHINDYTNILEITCSIGWFFRCNSERLLYFRYLNNQNYDVVDLDLPKFKNYIQNCVVQWKHQKRNNQTPDIPMQLQSSWKTTGAINLIFPINKIPEGYKHWFSWDGEQWKRVAV